jgi:SAM-dependent methyltransferase
MHTPASKPKGLFINPKKANCSIYESGCMMHKSLLLSDKYDLDYIEIDAHHRDMSNQYDFYAFNYHPLTMGWLRTKTVRLLPGPKITFVLEMLPNNPFVMCPKKDFDAYCVLDPTMSVTDRRVYAFTRPLEIAKRLSPYHEAEIPIIGSFGFATPGKGFEHVIAAVNKEFDRAIVRINMPSGTYADDAFWKLHKKNYADYLSELCLNKAKEGIQVVITRDYMTKDELIEWCGQNTLNCFLYNRNIPGLSATTDQAISSGRPLAVSSNETFRHIHQYIRPYPFQSLKESIASSQLQVLKMQRDWAPAIFASRFETVLADMGVFSRISKKERGPSMVSMQKNSLTDSLITNGKAGAKYLINRMDSLFLRFQALVTTPRKSLCKFLKSKAEVYQCTQFLKNNGYASHRLVCKDWDIANIIADLSDGNLLDMGSSDSYILKNAVIKGVSGEKFGIDLQESDAPINGVKYIIGDLLNAPFPDQYFQNITCLSVIEHEVNFNKFAKEVSRLLSNGGKLYLTFDYWSPKIKSNIKIFGKEWNLLDKNDTLNLIQDLKTEGLHLVEEVDWSLGKPVIDSSYYSPDPNIGYTFGMLVFKKKYVKSVSMTFDKNEKA